CDIFVFFFQAEDGIRDFHVTGVQTCALPISEITMTWPIPSRQVKQRRLTKPSLSSQRPRMASVTSRPPATAVPPSPRRSLCRPKIGRASCRERVKICSCAGASDTNQKADEGL